MLSPFMAPQLHSVALAGLIFVQNGQVSLSVNRFSLLFVITTDLVGRIKSWFAGIEPGQRVLDWLSIGSQGQWDLNRASLTYKYPENGIYPFVFSGQRIDNAVYDFLNSYLKEPGSDGVVRVAGANMNYRFLSLSQTGTVLQKKTRNKPETLSLKADIKAYIRKPQPIPIGVFGRYSHSGSKTGIMGSVKKTNANDEPIVLEILFRSSNSSLVIGERCIAFNGK
jgi:hypothetical protein